MNGCGDLACSSDNGCFTGDCTSCLESSEGCAWVPGEGCLTSCDIIADTACFPSSNYTADEVCEQGDTMSSGETQTSDGVGGGSCDTHLLTIAAVLAAIVVAIIA